MQVRTLSIAALVVGVTAFTPRPTPPSVQRFKVTETNHQVVDLTGVGGPQQTSHVVTSSYLTVTRSDSARGQAVTVVIDSIHLDSLDAQGVDPSTFDSLRGSRATGWLAPDGTLQNVQADTAKGGVAKGALRLLFPKLNTRVKVGDRWTDTTDVPGQGNGLLANATIKRVTNWAVNSGQAPDGTNARKVESAFSESITGQMETGQGAIGYDGTATGTGTYFLNPAGQQVGCSTTLNLSLSLTAPGAPEPIPVTGTLSAVATPIR